LVWDGSWSPKRGYGAIQRGDGRWMLANGQFTYVGPGAAVPGVVHQGLVTTDEQGFTWTLDGDARGLTYPYYGGTSRSFALGGFGSTVAFDNVIIEGTVDGFESDGTESNPDVIHGSVENLADGRVRITYDFSTEQQKFDFIVNDTAGTRRELNDGRLIISHSSVSSALKVALYKYNLRIDRMSYRAELLAGDHVNLYLNTIWDGNWAPNVGCAGIHRQDGRIIAVNGNVSATADTNPVAPRTVYTGDVVLDGTGIDWTVNGTLVSLDSPCYSEDNGTFGIGSHASDVAFDQIVFEGELQ
jgi:acylphosphatase